jgi:hypothetical protein
LGDVMSSPLVTQQEHVTYRNDIDDLFSFTSGALSELWMVMQIKNGTVNREMFARFYRGFNDLFMQTSKSKIMHQEQALIDQIEHWMDYTHPINATRVREGRKLFLAWGNALEARGIHTYTK